MKHRVRVVRVFCVQKSAMIEVEAGSREHILVLLDDDTIDLPSPSEDGWAVDHTELMQQEVAAERP